MGENIDCDMEQGIVRDMGTCGYKGILGENRELWVQGIVGDGIVRGKWRGGKELWERQGII